MAPSKDGACFIIGSTMISHPLCKGKIMLSNCPPRPSKSAQQVQRFTCLILLTSCLTFGLSACANLDKALLAEAGFTALQAITLSDSQIQNLSRQAAMQQDQKNTLAPGDNAYSQRLNRLVKQHANEAGLQLNYRVYLSQNVNAFAMADGTIRIYSGLMDIMSDEELLFVIGHEIGHVRHGHSKKIAQLAYATTATRKGVAAVGGTLGALAASELGQIAQSIVQAQYSQKEELEADDYGLSFMRRHGYSSQAAVTGLRKLGSGGGGLLASHPDSAERAERLASRL